MSDPGGQITHLGVLYQDRIAALYLGRMIDPRAVRKPPDQQVVEVRGEKPGAEVDDVYVRFADGHARYIQAKTALPDHGEDWEKLWEHLYRQQQRPDFNRSKDRLVLLMGDFTNWYKELDSICSKASSSVSLEEWQQRLSQRQTHRAQKIQALLNRRLQPETTLTDDDNYRLLGCIDLEFIQNKTLEEEKAIERMPDSSLSPAALFNQLVSLVTRYSSEGRRFNTQILLSELTRLEIQIKPLEQQRELPVPRRCDYYSHISKPTHPVDRPELLDEVRRAILDNPGGVALSSATPARALYGIGGIGKSVTARLLCDDPQVQAEYPDGILWANLGQHPDIRQRLKEWADALSLRLEAVAPSEDQYKAALSEALRSKQVLLIVDDAWHDEHLKFFQVAGPDCQMLVTTRIPALAERLGAELYRVPPMAQAEAVSLLELWARGGLDEIPYGEKVQVVQRLGRLPLAVKLAGAKLKTIPPREWLSQLSELRRLDAEPDSDDPEKSLRASFRLSLDGLSPKQQQLYQALGIFPEDEAILDAPIIRLWQALDPEKDPAGCRDLMDYLGGLALLERSGDGGRTISLHDLLRQYLREQLGESGRGDLHKRLLDSYAITQVVTGWHTASDDGYLYGHLAYHLAESGQLDRLLGLFANDAWLHARVAGNDYQYNGYLADLDLTWKHVCQKAQAQIAASQPVTAMVDCIHLALVRTSINSLASNYDPVIVARAVELRVPGWTPQRAVSLISHIPDAEKRCEMLTALLSVEQVPAGIQFDRGLKQQMIDQALQAALEIRDKRVRAEALSILAERLEGEWRHLALDHALEAAVGIWHEGERVMIMSELAQKLEGEQVERALQAALEIPDEIFCAEVLSGLAEKLEGEQVERALRAALAFRMLDQRAKVLGRLASKLEGEQRRMAVEHALQATLATDYGLYQQDFLGLLVHMLEREQVERALHAAQAIRSATDRGRVLVELAAKLEGEQRQKVVEQAVQAAMTIKDEWWRADALSTQASRLEGKQRWMAVERALRAALEIPVHHSRATMLGRIAEKLEGEQRLLVLNRALKTALVIQSELYRAEALTGLAQVLEGEQRLLALKRALQAAQRIASEDILNRARILSELAQLLEGGRLVKRALQAALKIRDEEQRSKVLAALANKLEGEQVDSALRSALSIQKRGPRAQALSRLAQKLDRQQVERALQSTLAIGDEDLSGAALSSLRQKLEKKKPRQALHTPEAIWRVGGRVTASIGLLQKFKRERVERVLQAALAIENEGQRADTLSEVASRLEGEQVERALQAALEIRRPGQRAKVLGELACKLEGEQVERALQKALAFRRPGQRTNVLSELACKLEGEQVERALQAMEAIRNQEQRAKVLSELAQKLEGEQVERALQSVLVMINDRVRGEALCSLAGRLEGEQIERALQSALAIVYYEDKRAEAVSALVEKLEGEQVERALQAGLEIKEEGARGRILGQLAKRLDYDRQWLEQVQQASLAVFTRYLTDYRGKILEILALPDLITPKMLGLERAEFAKIAHSVISVTTQWRWL